MLKKLFKKRIVNYSSPITPKKEINALIQKLQPRQTKKELIRLGPNRDGGYLLPNDLEGVTTCFSPGVAMVSGFELDCLNLDMNVHMADKSVEKPNLDIPEDRYSFVKKYIGCTNNSDFMTMNSWVSSANLKESDDLLLQMDIELGEYPALINISDDLMERFRIMVIEFHHLHDWWNKYYFDFNKIVFEKILQTHTCVHIHPNNCCGIDYTYGVAIPRVAEFTFLRNDRDDFKEYCAIFPHKLDCNNVEHETIVLPKNWYKG